MIDLRVFKRIKIKSVWKYRFVVAVLAFCVLLYTLYHVMSLFGEDMSTFAAGVTTEVDALSGTGYIFRDETVLRSEKGGVVNYACSDGTKVAKGDKLAVIYEGGSQKDRKSIEMLDRQIAILEQGGSNVSTVDIAALQKDITDDYYILTRMLAGGQTGELSSRIDEFLVGMDKLSVATEEESAVTGTLEALREQKNEMLGASGTSKAETAPDGGYFYTSADGYEEVFTMEALQTLDAESFAEITTQKKTLSNAGGTPYGRLADTSVWAFVMEISAKESGQFEEAGEYSVEFTENNGITLPMTLTGKIDMPTRSTVLLVFECDRLPENFDFIRCQSVRIELESVSGIYVPQSAVHLLDGYEGVYILRGSVVHFRYIYVLYEGSDYYLVDESGADDGLPYLSPNDLIILNGTNLFEGRILE